MPIPHSGNSLPSVTVLTAAYNYAGFIGRTLDSALAQDYPPELLDIVVVDDGSTDDSAAVLDDYQRRFPDRITVIRQENAGYVAATNRAAAEARGDILAILDADDLWPVDKTRRQVDCLLKDSEVGLIYCDTEIIDPYDEVRRPSLWQWHGMKPQRGANAFAAIMDQAGNTALASTIVMRASLAAHVFPIPPRVPYVDWWMTARVAAVAAIDFLPELRVGYRQHGENLTLGVTGLRRVREHLKVAEVRRQLLIHGAAEHLTEPSLLAAWRAWDNAALAAVAQASSAYVALPAPSDEERARAAQHAAAADRAVRVGDPRTALRERIVALACDPLDILSREWVQELAALSEAEAAVAEGPPPAVDPLAEVRGFVTLVALEEIAAEPQLLGSYASVVSEEDDATLVIAAEGVDEARAVQLVADAAARTGRGLDALPDVLLVTADGPRVTFELQRRADALLTRRPSKLDTPTFHPGCIGALRELLAAGATGSARAAASPAAPAAVGAS